MAIRLWQSGTAIGIGRLAEVIDNMSRRQLTSKQHAFLQYVRSYIRDNDVWPTYREIVDFFDFRSPNSVTQNLQALHKKGFLR